MGDKTRLQQVVMNLLSNALKFTKEGFVEVRIHLLEQSDTQVFLQFMISDTGIGIPEEGLSRIFDPFRQVDASTTREYGGTGLGLAISQHIIKALGGRIQVESAPNFGACFHFEIFIDRVHAAPSASPKAITGLTERPPQRATIEVLVAEDNPVNRMVVTRLLERFGVSVKSASDGREALELARTQQFSLILMDVHMPYLDGLEVTRSIRALENGVRVPIVALTAGASDEDRQACLAAGMDDYVSKPFSPVDLERILKAYC